jgi:hypothetical protein
MFKVLRALSILHQFLFIGCFGGFFTNLSTGTRRDRTTSSIHSGLIQHSGCRSARANRSHCHPVGIFEGS